jgi:hypothetical protein
LLGGIRSFASGISDTHDELLYESERSLLYKKQIDSAKHLAASTYRKELSVRNAFAEINGNVADKLTGEEISALYNEEFFLERLRTLGFYKNDVSSEAINKRNGIIRAQSAFNIPITAKIDLETMRALLPGTDYLPRDVISGEHPDGMWVLINKSSRILTVYIDDKVHKKFPVAIGSNPSLTPNGQFTFVSKYINPRWGGGGYAAPIAGGVPQNPLGKRWIGISKGGGGRYGVHGNASPNSIGTNASHGCIRMINQDVEEMYEYVELGTPVWIGTAETIAEWGITQELGSVEPVMPDYRDYLPTGFTEERST